MNDMYDEVQLNATSDEVGRYKLDGRCEMETRIALAFSQGGAWGGIPAVLHAFIGQTAKL